jgi:uncharacterized membrane protein (DUF2068 family)
MGVPVTQTQARPQAIDERASTAGLRTVASFEALKGIVVLLLGLTLIVLHHHAEDYAERLLYHLHMDPDRRFAHALMLAATKVNDVRLWTILAATITYSTVRFVEAWGLWNRRVWAEWFALLSGAMYLPWEILKVSERADWERIAVLIVNVIIVLYMLEIRIRGCSTLTGCEERGSEKF